MTLPSTLAYGQVRDWGGIVGASLDGDTTPDVTPIAGTVTFTPSVPVQLVADSPRSRWLYAKPQTYGYDATGTLRDANGNPTVTLIATDSPGLSRQDWTWVASFHLTGGVTREPFAFRLAGGATVDLTDATPVQQSAGMAITRGLPGLSAYDVAVEEGFTGTEAEWLATLVGPPGDPAQLAAVALSGAYSDLTGRPVIPDSPDDIGAQPAGDYATAQSVIDARARANHTGTQTSATISDLTEAVQDIVGGFFGAGTGASVTYDDAANTLTVSATGTSDPEAIRDAIGAALVGVGNINVAVNDAGDTITISTTATVNATDSALRDRSTHTGTQPVSSITGLAPVATSGSYNDLTDKPAASGGSSTDLAKQMQALYGLKGWSMDPLLATAAQVMVSGTMYLSRMLVTPGEVLTSFEGQVTSAGSSVTLFRAALYAESGTLLRSTANMTPVVGRQTSAWQSSGADATYTVPAGVTAVYVALLAVGTTPPTVARAAATSNATVLAASMTNGVRSGTKASQTDLPSPLGTQAASNVSLFLASS